MATLERCSHCNGSGVELRPETPRFDPWATARGRAQKSDGAQDDAASMRPRSGPFAVRSEPEYVTPGSASTSKAAPTSDRARENAMREELRKQALEELATYAAKFQHPNDVLLPDGGRAQQVSRAMKTPRGKELYDSYTQAAALSAATIMSDGS